MYEDICELNFYDLMKLLKITDRVGEENIHTKSKLLDVIKDFRVSFIGNEKGLHILNSNIVKYYFDKKKMDKTHIKYIHNMLLENNLIKPYYDESCINTLPIVEYSIFALFHEEGHWVRSKLMTESDLHSEVQKIEKIQRKRYLDSKKIYDDYVNNPENYNEILFLKSSGQPINYMDEKTKYKFEKEYREFVWEEESDKYAIKMMKENKELIDSIKNTYWRPICL